MALDPVVNFFRSTIATLPVASGGTSIVITTGDGAKLPDPAVDGNFNLTIYNEDDPFDAPEIVRVTAISGDTLTVTRAQEGTSATNKTSGNTWYLELTPTAKTIQDIDSEKLDVADVVNNLTSTDTDKPLSANQGKVLQDGKAEDNVVVKLTGAQTVAGVKTFTSDLIAPNIPDRFNNPLQSLTLTGDAVNAIDGFLNFGSLSGTGKWVGGVLAPNGKIYGIPFGSTTVLEIDPVEQTTTTFGSLSGSSKWIGGVLAPNGKIYGIPVSSTTVLEIDPVAQTTTTFGSLSGTAKWYGGVLAPNGKIYGIPQNSTTVLEIDPVEQTTTTFGSLSGSSKWVGGVLAPNGKIYAIPLNSTTVLEIDPVAQTATTFGSLSGSSKWVGGVLAPNGKIYGIPVNSTTVLEIDPVAQTATTFGSLSGSSKWYGGVLAPNGKIYGIPVNSTTVLEIDPVAQTTTTFGSLSGTGKWAGGVLAPNGKIYGIPFNSTYVLEIANGAYGNNWWALSAYTNKL